MSNFRNVGHVLHCSAVGCESSLVVTHGQLIDHATVRCPRGHEINLVGDTNGLRQVDQSLNQLKRRFGRNLTIKF